MTSDDDFEVPRLANQAKKNHSLPPANDCVTVNKDYCFKSRLQESKKAEGVKNKVHDCLTENVYNAKLQGGMESTKQKNI